MSEFSVWTMVLTTVLMTPGFIVFLIARHRLEHNRHCFRVYQEYFHPREVWSWPLREFAFSLTRFHRAGQIKIFTFNPESSSLGRFFPWFLAQPLALLKNTALSPHCPLSLLIGFYPKKIVVFIPDSWRQELGDADLWWWIAHEAGHWQNALTTILADFLTITFRDSAYWKDYFLKQEIRADLFADQILGRRQSLLTLKKSGLFYQDRIADSATPHPEFFERIARLKN